MKQNNVNETNFPTEIQIVTFAIDGVAVGVEASQIEKIVEAQDVVNTEVEVNLFHEKAGFLNKEIVYESPKVLLIRGETSRRAVMIDGLSEISTFNIDVVRPVPEIVRASSTCKAMWGVVAQKDELVILFDLSKLQ